MPPARPDWLGAVAAVDGVVDDDVSAAEALMVPARIPPARVPAVSRPPAYSNRLRRGTGLSGGVFVVSSIVSSMKIFLSVSGSTGVVRDHETAAGTCTPPATCPRL